MSEPVEGAGRKRRSKWRGVLYVAAAGGFLYWARRSHLLTQFRHVRDIPQSYLDTHIRLRGTVAAVLPDATLRVQHEPLIPVEHWLNTRVRPDASPACISVKAAGVKVENVGTQHLIDRVVGDRVWFEPVMRDHDTLHANITAKRPGTRRPVLYNLNRDLIQRGYARVLDNSDKQHVRAVKTVAQYSRLVNQMQIVQRGAGATVGSEVSESVLTWPLHIRQVIQNSSLYQIGVIAASALYVAAYRLFRFVRVLAGRERNQVPIERPADVLEFIRVYGLGVERGTTNRNPGHDARVLRSYNFPTKAEPGFAAFPVLTAKSALQLLGNIIRSLIGLMGLALKTGFRVTKKGVGMTRKAIKNAQSDGKKK